MVHLQALQRDKHAHSCKPTATSERRLLMALDTARLPGAGGACDDGWNRKTSGELPRDGVVGADSVRESPSRGEARVGLWIAEPLHLDRLAEPAYSGSRKKSMRLASPHLVGMRLASRRFRDIVRGIGASIGCHEDEEVLLSGIFEPADGRYARSASLPDG